MTATATQVPADKAMLFESTVCTRCGGSGHHSYCQMYGTRCFKCGGRGRTMTKRGAAAQEFYRMLLSKRADELQPGDKIQDLGVPGFSSGGWRTIVEIVLNSEAQRSGRVFRLSEIEKIEAAVDRGASVKPTVLNGEKAAVVYEGLNIVCEGFSAGGVSPDAIYRVAASADRKREARDEALVFQASLTKLGKLRKRSVR